MSTSCWPASIGSPPTSASSVATRHMLWMGVTQRMNSSTATDGSAPALSFAHWSGWAMRSRIVRAMTVRVVSAPPSSSSRQSEMTVSTVTPSPSTSAWVQIDMMSSAGQRDFSAWRSLAAWANSMAATMPSSLR